MGFALIVRAVVTGVTVTLALRYGVGIPLGALVRGLAVGHPVARILMASWVPAATAMLVWMASGWVVARVNRLHPMAAAVTYLIFIHVWSLPRTYTVVVNALDDLRFVPGLFAHGTELVAATIGILAGGWLANLGTQDAPARVTPGL